MVEMKMCWISESGRHFDTQDEAHQHDMHVFLDKELEDIFTRRTASMFEIRNKRKEIFEAINKYYEKGGK